MRKANSSLISNSHFHEGKEEIMSQLCRTKVIAIFAAVVLLSVVTGCAKEKAIKLGHIGDYTGIGEMLSTSEKKGQLLAIEGNYSGCKRSSEYSSNLHENFTPISHVWGILYSL